ncbi:Inactive poly [ADP-ribose] polymerase RCD1 [Acorus calamus]|uniref:Inactive poly [ADP-ribose] polymerase RCD1 n=1 Tax=Acorus calamus TaxID=4465 RepID=A0AAV9CSY1_ACOCL|nr:Inactive poly [ADP-ribose] polymerase RCD1 [Acorus calamus]
MEGTALSQNRTDNHDGSRDLVQNYSNFKTSAAPSRFLLCRDGSWDDVSDDAFELLRAGFVSGRVALEVSMDGSSYLFDFMRMVRIELETGHQKPFAWIDVNGRCFFPTTDESSNSPQKVEIEIKIDTCLKKNPLKRKTISNPPPPILSPSSDVTQREEWGESFIETANPPKKPRWTYLEPVSEGDRAYALVSDLFFDEMRRFYPGITITSISKCSHTGAPGTARLRAFQLQLALTRSARGSANVRFAWHGTSARGVDSIVKHGFGQPNRNSHGTGVYLSPPRCPYSSSLLSEVDENGQRYLLLCRVIMGRSERVEAGSSQFHPSSDEYDSGVDDLANPRWYIIWSTHMNTHILPEYVVSFKSATPDEEIKKSIPAAGFRTLENLYKEYKAGKFSKAVLIRHIRSIAGDKLLTSTIKGVSRRK